MIPPTLKIGAHTFLVHQVEKNDLSDSNIAACIDRDRQIITIPADAPASRQLELTLHECVHAMLEGHDLGDKEELVCVLLGQSLALFIMDNPKFFSDALKTLRRS